MKAILGRSQDTGPTTEVPEGSAAAVEAGPEVQRLDSVLVIVEGGRESAHDWRWQEVIGSSAASAPSGGGPADGAPLTTPRLRTGPRARGGDWREEEIFGASASSSCGVPELPTKALPARGASAAQSARRGGKRRNGAHGKQPAEEDRDDDWRMLEVTGASASGSASAGAASTEAQHPGRRRSRQGAEDWREQELLGASAVSLAMTPRSRRGSGAEAPLLPPASPSMTEGSVEAPAAPPASAPVASAPSEAAAAEAEAAAAVEAAAAAEAPAAPPASDPGASAPTEPAAAEAEAAAAVEAAAAAEAPAAPPASAPVASAPSEAAAAEAEAAAAVEAAATAEAPGEGPREEPGEAPEPPQLGDIVVLGPGAPPEFRQCPGVVTQVAAAHCTVVVLDEARRLGAGECWPGFGDIKIESRSLRLGSRVVIDGLQSARAKRLNGFAGTVSSHPSKGHPTFISKPSAPDRPQLTICVALDDPKAAGEKTVLLEPRFLTAYEAYAAQTAGDLSSALASLCAAGVLAAADSGGPPCGAAALPPAGGLPYAAVPT